MPYPHVPIALVRAQKLAEHATKPSRYLIRRHPLIGPHVDVARVVRDVDGSVWTTVLSHED